MRSSIAGGECEVVWRSCSLVLGGKERGCARACSREVGGENARVERGCSQVLGTLRFLQYRAEELQEGMLRQAHIGSVDT